MTAIIIIVSWQVDEGARQCFLVENFHFKFTTPIEVQGQHQHKSGIIPSTCFILYYTYTTQPILLTKTLPTNQSAKVFLAKVNRPG